MASASRSRSAMWSGCGCVMKMCCSFSPAVSISVSTNAVESRNRAPSKPNVQNAPRSITSWRTREFTFAISNAINQG